MSEITTRILPGERVIALDPGERTGWASAIVSENRIANIEHGVLPQKEMALQLYQWQVPKPRYNVIVMEGWRPRPKPGVGMSWIIGDPLLSAQHLGQIRFIGWISGAKLVTQGPERKSIAEKTLPDTLKDRMALCHEQHDQDAILHLHMYFWTNWVTDPANITID